MLADRLTPLLALARPLARDLEGVLRQRQADGGQREPAGVERRQRDTQPLALAADDVLAGDEDVVEAGHRVLDAPEAHEGVAVLDRDAVAVARADERGDAAL